MQFKLTTLTSNAFHIGRLPYHTDLLQHDQPTKAKSLRSSFSHQQFILRHNLLFGSCALHFLDPQIWNYMSLLIRES